MSDLGVYNEKIIKHTISTITRVKVRAGFAPLRFCKPLYPEGNYPFKGKYNCSSVSYILKKYLNCFLGDYQNMYCSPLVRVDTQQYGFKDLPKLQLTGKPLLLARPYLQGTII